MNPIIPILICLAMSIVLFFLAAIVPICLWLSGVPLFIAAVQMIFLAICVVHCKIKGYDRYEYKFLKWTLTVEKKR